MSHGISAVFEWDIGKRAIADADVQYRRGMAEYPELEMLPPLIMGGGDGAVCGEERFVTARTSLGDEVGKTREAVGGGGGRKMRGQAKLAGHAAAGDATRPRKQRKSVDRLIAGSGRGKVRSMAHAIDAPPRSCAAAKTMPRPGGWETMYDSCVDLGMLRSPNLSREAVSACNNNAGLVQDPRMAAAVGGSEEQGSGEGMRKSTLDFKRSLEEGERRSWERLRRLGAAAAAAPGPRIQMLET